MSKDISYKELSETTFNHGIICLVAGAVIMELGYLADSYYPALSLGVDIAGVFLILFALWNLFTSAFYLYKIRTMAGEGGKVSVVTEIEQEGGS